MEANTFDGKERNWEQGQGTSSANQGGEMTTVTRLIHLHFSQALAGQIHGRERYRSSAAHEVRRFYDVVAPCERPRL